MPNSQMDHTVTAFDDDLQYLTQQITLMGGHAGDMVARALSALATADRDLAQSVIDDDAVLDDMERELDERAVTIIARRQPMAHDLRAIIGAIRIGNDLERIGDLGTNMARRVFEIDDVVQPKRISRGLNHLTGRALQQLNDILDAYANQDVNLANKVWHGDEEVDAIYTSIFRELLTYMMEDPRKISMCTHLLFCAKNLERIGDHATNLAETIMYIEEGHTRMSAPEQT